MVPGQGYVLQLGGNGTYTDVVIDGIIQNFSGGSVNNGTIPVPVTTGKFALLGNPYGNYLDLDYFLLNANNKTKIKGPVFLWTHNTVISTSNPSDPSNTSPYRYSANDYAMYNVLGGVESGRSISTSAENGLYAGIQVPSGKLCFGTGFFVTGIGTGTVNFEDNMRDNDITNITPQSFKTTTPAPSPPVTTQSFLPSLVTRSRIWLNLEKVDTSTPYTPLKQVLIGYSTGYNGESPTDGENDRVFDAPAVTATSYMKFYSYVPNASNPAVTPGNPGTNTPLALGIQGRPTFNPNNFFQLGYSVTVAGDYTITTTNDGIFASTTSPQRYYIFDTEDNQRHNLPYNFNTVTVGNPSGVGFFDTRLRVVFENPAQITSTDCGNTIATISTTLFSTQISGATTYKFEVRTASGALVGVYDGNVIPLSLNYRFNLNITGAIQYNTTYIIRVATYQVDGAYVYGLPCTITTPPPPQTKIDNSYCNTILSSKNNTIYCGQITGQLGFSSSGYRFEVSEGTPGNVVGIIEKFNSSFQLANIEASSGYNNPFPAHTVLPNTNYFIRVQIKYNDSGTALWQVDGVGNPIYGPTCMITTSNPARLANTPFKASIYPNPFSNNFKIDLEGGSQDNQVNLYVYDMLGRIVESRLLNSSDSNMLEIGENFASGVYNVIIKQDDDIQSLRIIKR